MSAEAAQTSELSAELGLREAISLVLGAVIGSAIFLVPSTVLGANPAPLAAMFVFLAGGLLSWLGALAYAELGSMFPRTGGEYIYLRESWGELAAFVCGWSHFLVIQTAGIAALAVGFSSLVAVLLPLSPLALRLLAPVLILVLTTLNYRGVRPGAWTGNVFTLLKIAGLLFMLAAVVNQSEPVAVDWSWPSGWTPAQLAVAIVPVLWAYEGWNLVTFVSGEIRDARRNVPIALGVALLLVVAVYGASLWVYLRTLTVPEIVTSAAVAPAAAMRALGPSGGTFVTLTMIFAVVGATNAAVLAAPRVYYAQARDGLFFRAFAHVHPLYRTPSKGLLFQCVWSATLSLTGSYEVLLTSCIFVAWLIYGSCAAGVLVLRHRRPDIPRGYRMWGAPWTTILFCVTSAAVVVGSFLTRPLASGAGLCLMLSGIPLYLHWRRRKMNRCNT